MTKFKKFLAGAAGAALITMTAAAPAQAGDIDVEEIIAGVAILGGVAVAINALDGNGNRGRQYGNYGYGYGNGQYGNYPNGAYPNGTYPNGGNYGYGNGYGYNGMGTAQSAVNVCAREAQRYGGGQVTISDVDRTNGGYRVRGKAMVPDYNDSRYGRYDYDRESFTCHAANGRIYDFRI